MNWWPIKSTDAIYSQRVKHQCIWRFLSPFGMWWIFECFLLSLGFRLQQSFLKLFPMRMANARDFHWKLLSVCLIQFLVVFDNVESSVSSILIFIHKFLFAFSFFSEEREKKTIIFANVSLMKWLCHNITTFSSQFENIHIFIFFSLNNFRKNMTASQRRLNAKFIRI